MTFSVLQVKELIDYTIREVCRETVKHLKEKAEYEREKTNYEKATETSLEATNAYIAGIVRGLESELRMSRGHCNELKAKAAFLYEVVVAWNRNTIMAPNSRDRIELERVIQHCKELF